MDDQTPTTYTTVTTVDQLVAELLQMYMVSKSRVLCVDTETTGLLPLVDRLLLVQLYTREYGTLIIDCRAIHVSVIGTFLRPYFESSEWLKVAHNWAFDYGFLCHHLKTEIHRLYDTLVAEQLLTSGTLAPCDLKSCMMRYFEVGMEKDIRKRFIGMTEETEFDDEMLTYAAEDVIRLPDLMREQLIRLRGAKLLDIARIDFACLPVLVHAHLRGIRINRASYTEQIEAIRIEAERRELELQAILTPHVEVYRRTKLGEKLHDYEIALAHWSAMRGAREEMALAAKAEALRQGATGKEAQQVYNAAKKAVPCPPKPPRPTEGSGPINLSSHEQLGQALLLAGVPLKVVEGKPKTDKYALQDVEDEWPLVAEVLEWRGMEKLVTSFGDAIVTLLDSDDCLHPQFTDIGAATGRMSCKRPNVMQMPNNLLGRGLRECFVARDGYQLLAVDYSQIELRILAEIAGEESLIWAINNGLDPHSMTAYRMFPEVRSMMREYLSEQSVNPASQYTSDEINALFKVLDLPVDELVLAGTQNPTLLLTLARFFAIIKSEKRFAELRHIAKTINFGIAYGFSARGLSNRVRLSMEEAREAIHNFERSNPNIMRWLKKVHQEVHNTGAVRTLAGRVRWFLPNRHDSVRERWDYERVKGRIERQAGNHPIQGFSADMMKMAVVAIYADIRERGLDATMLMFIHDELVLEVRTAQVAQVQELVERHMIAVGERYMHRVRVEVDAHVGDHWIH